MQISTLVAAVLNEERQLSEEDIILLFSARGADFELVCAAAGKVPHSFCMRSGCLCWPRQGKVCSPAVIASWRKGLSLSMASVVG